MNARMFPNSGRMFHALETLDFFVDTDLFMTDAAKYADIVLPACTSFERGEFKPYPNGTAWYTSPVIEPLGQAKSDTDIITELARYMDLPDEQLSPLSRSTFWMIWALRSSSSRKWTCPFWCVNPSPMWTIRSWTRV